VGSMPACGAASSGAEADAADVARQAVGVFSAITLHGVVSPYGPLKIAHGLAVPTPWPCLQEDHDFAPHPF